MNLSKVGQLTAVYWILGQLIVLADSMYCSRHEYYDPITHGCHPCSDCSDGRSTNLYCVQTCQVSTQCSETEYYDGITKECHSCSDCAPSRTPNQYCLAQCQDTETSLKPVPATQATSEGSAEIEKIMVIVFVTVFGIIVLVLVILTVLYFTKWRHTETTEQIGTPLMETDRNGNGNVIANAASMSNGEVRQSAPRSLPLTFSPPSNSSEIAGQRSEPQTLCIQPASAMVPEDGGNNVLAMPGSQNAPAVIQLEEDDFSPDINHSYRNSFRQNSSLMGQPVCHPEQEDNHFNLAPTLTLSAAGPHVSLDSTKGCCQADVELRMALVNSSHSETDLKSSR